MANPDSPFGFQILKTEGKHNRVTVYNKAASAIFAGDVVTLGAAGTVATAIAGGVVCGIASESKSATDTTIGIYDDPDSEFMVQSSGTFAAADVGQNADIVATAADTTLSRSKHAINTATQAVTATLQFKILGLTSRMENAVGAQAIITVKPNNHVKSTGVAGI